MSVPAEQAIADSTAVTQLEALIGVESDTRKTTDHKQLGFLIANDTHRVVPYYQCVVWKLNLNATVDVVAVSGVAALDRNTTALRDVRKIVRGVAREHRDGDPASIDAAGLESSRRKLWKQYLPRYAHWRPLKGEDGAVVGGLLLTRDSDFTDSDLDLVGKLAEGYERQWQWLGARSFSRRFVPGAKGRLTKGAITLAALLVLGVLIRVPAAFVGQAQIIAADPVLVSSPVEGVIESFVTRPNEFVAQGEPLFKFRDTELRNDVEVAEKSLMVAIADHERARQRALTDQREKPEVELFRLTVQQRQAEVDFANARLKRSQVTAPADGVALFTDPQSLVGKPLAMGERIMTIADPDRIRVQVWAPVDTMTSIEPGATVRFYLESEPGRARYATLETTSFEPELSPGGVLAHRLEATLEADEELPRLGATGSARVYAKKVSLIWYLLRRPLARAWQFVGL